MTKSATFTLDLADYIAFNKLYWRSRVWNMLGTISAICAALGAIEFFNDGSWMSILTSTFFGLLVGAFLWTIYYFLGLPICSRKIFEETFFFKEEQNWKIVDGGIEVVQPNGHSNLLWKDMILWMEDEQYFIFYANRIMGYIFPKTKVNEGFVAELRESLRESGLTKPRKRR
ncbi:MAG: YcxB family protein [Pontixanthobacter sp.]